MSGTTMNLNRSGDLVTSGQNAVRALYAIQQAIEAGLANSGQQAFASGYVSAGANQATATELGNAASIVIANATTGGCRLVVAVPGTAATVWNGDASNTATLYAPTGAVFQGLGAGVGITIASGARRSVLYLSSTVVLYA